MGDFDRWSACSLFIIEGKQAMSAEALDHLLRDLFLPGNQIEFGAQYPTACILNPFAQCDQPQEKLAGRRLTGAVRSTR